MNISSFDIFDTCLLRRCGLVREFYGVLSYKVFNEDVPERVRKDFAVARKKAEDTLWSKMPHLRLEDIYEALLFSHPALKPVQELVAIEQALETEMLSPSAEMKAVVDRCREKGDRILFISDMYLPTELLKEALKRYGFYKDGDGLYISSDCGYQKATGELFRHVKEREGASFHRWEHYGDDRWNDVKMPKALGIKAHHVPQSFTPYQQKWKDEDFSMLYRYPSVMAGISRSICHEMAGYSHCAFICDLIAPLYCSYVYNVLRDAHERGLKRLFFCARDAYQIYHIALVMAPLFPDLTLDYLFISRTALYGDNDEAKLAYFKSTGLACETAGNAIVDITTSGKTLLEMNEFLKKNGCAEVFGYFFLLWDDPRRIPVNKSTCRFELEAAHMFESPNFRTLRDHIYIFENYFALNNQAKTTDYQFIDGTPKPVFADTEEEGETIVDDKEHVIAQFKEVLTKYAETYVSTEAYRYSASIMHDVAMPTLATFVQVPEAYYLKPLTSYYVCISEQSAYIPYISKMNIIANCLLHKGHSMWPKASIMYALPSFLKPVYRRYILSKSHQS